MALNKGIWDPTARGTNIKGTNLKSLGVALHGVPGAHRSSLALGLMCSVQGKGVKGVELIEKSWQVQGQG